jgi:hypothetical protein
VAADSADRRAPAAGGCRPGLAGPGAIRPVVHHQRDRAGLYQYVNTMRFADWRSRIGKDANSVSI